MTAWRKRRFWQRAVAVPAAEGHEVHLDDRPLTTPARARLRLPSVALASAVAEEWQAVEAAIDPNRMPLTRLANAAIDRVPAIRGDLTEELLWCGAHDLLCHRADGPAALAERQRAAWDPLLDWAARHHGAWLIATTGVMPVEQPAESLARFRSALNGQCAFGLAALSELVALSGSLVIGLAALEGVEEGNRLWRVAEIDEIWQREQWGEDAEAAALTAHRRRAFLTAWRLARLIDAKAATRAGAGSHEIEP